MRSTCSLSLFKLPPETEKLSLRHQFRIVLRHIFPSLRSGDRDAAGMADGAVAVRAQCGNEPRASSIGGISSAPPIDEISRHESLRNKAVPLRKLSDDLHHRHRRHRRRRHLHPHQRRSGRRRTATWSGRTRTMTGS
jgi:hypothetical protein